MEIIETFQSIEDQNKELTLIRSIESFQREASTACAHAKVFQVSSPEAAKEAVRISGLVKQLSKNIDAARKAVTDPYRKFINKINDIARGMTDSLDEVESLLNAKIGAWKKQETANLVTENEATAALMASLGVEVDVYKQEAPKTIRAEGATSYEKLDWAHEIVDESLIPREYLMVDERKIKISIKAGVRQIPGIKITQESKTMIRTR